MRKGSVPPGGWNARSFQQHGATLVTDFVRVARYSRRRFEKGLRESLLGHMRSQVDRLVATIRERKAAKAPGDDAPAFSVVLDLPGSEAFWTALLNDIFRDREDIVVETMVRPAIQSLVSQGANKTSVLLGTSLPVSTEQTVLPAIANQLAQNVRNINATTRGQLQEIITQAVQKGSTVRDTMKRITDEMGPKLEARAATIARTELNQAFTKGSIQTFLASPTVTHVSVIGCLHRNDSNNYWHGQHTCNIKMVPKQNANELTFHPNHTGTMVPAAFTA